MDHVPSFVRLYIYLFYSFSEDNFPLILHMAFFFFSIILNLVYLISSVWWPRWSTDANHGTSRTACTHFSGTPQSSYGSKQSPWEWPWLISCQLSRQWVIQFFVLFFTASYTNFFSICLYVFFSGFTYGWVYQGVDRNSLCFTQYSSLEDKQLLCHCLTSSTHAISYLNYWRYN